MTKKRQRSADVQTLDHVSQSIEHKQQSSTLTTLQDAAGQEVALLPIYIVHRPKRHRCGSVRFQFLLEAVLDLAKSIATWGGRLLVLRGDAEEVLSTIMVAWCVADFFFETGVMHYAVERDNRNGGHPPTIYERLLEITDKMAQPAVPIGVPLSLSNATMFSTSELFELLRQHDSSTADAMAGFDIDTSNAVCNLFAVPPLTELGLVPPDPHTLFINGESEAMKRLDVFCEDERRVGLFEKPKTSPVAVDATLSSYLIFGCLSAREFFHRIMCIQLQFRNRPDPTQATLEGQLMWREFFYCYACSTSNFDSQRRNPGRKQIAWRLLDEEYVTHPELDQNDLDGVTDADEKLAMHQLQCWKDGRTGFSWIDDVMRQINQEDWIHYAGRHAIACFFTRGVLYISWLRGAVYCQGRTSIWTGRLMLGTGFG
ncbi:unnamed protein product [Peronospora belbahrii]|uniref:Photolyase/cryptochrome alpha/beta domain-containing protein n=1 Tax=Peronospora belbahrii TaxID=622444 RepID=A0AAU9L6E6_9STRA|nr:unnamed protein product [Peronospora belbahrii]